MQKIVIKIHFPNAWSLLLLLLLKTLSKITGHLGPIEICNNKREQPVKTKCLNYFAL